jgi:hypothetical protein
MVRLQIDLAEEYTLGTTWCLAKRPKQRPKSMASWPVDCSCTANHVLMPASLQKGQTWRAEPFSFRNTTLGLSFACLSPLLAQQPWFFYTGFVIHRQKSNALSALGVAVQSILREGDFDHNCFDWSKLADPPAQMQIRSATC